MNKRCSARLVHGFRSVLINGAAILNSEVPQPLRAEIPSSGSISEDVVGFELGKFAFNNDSNATMERMISIWSRAALCQSRYYRVVVKIIWQ